LFGIPSLVGIKLGVAVWVVVFCSCATGSKELGNVTVSFDKIGVEEIAPSRSVKEAMEHEMPPPHLAGKDLEDLCS
jgi:hypothetical protein